MASINKAILIGNLGQDPELKYLPSGDAVCNFSIATTETWKDRDGNQQDKTEWHNIVAFRRLAEICGEYLKKGKQVYIEGRIQTRSWEQDGVKRYSTEIVADQMKMLGTRRDEEYGQNSSGGGYQQRSSKPQGPPPAMDDDDLPF